MAQAMRSTVATTSISTKSGVENCCRRVESPAAADVRPSRSGIRVGDSPGDDGLVIKRIEHVETGESGGGLLG